MTRWTAWQWDGPTALWSAWIAWFFLQEAIALWTPLPLDTLTAHLRPVFQAVDLAWFITFAVWLWLGKHFLLDGILFTVSGTG